MVGGEGRLIRWSGGYPAFTSSETEEQKLETVESHPRSNSI